MDVSDTTLLHEDVQRAEVQLHSGGTAAQRWYSLPVNKHQRSDSLPRKPHNINLFGGWVGPTIAVTEETR